MASDPYLEPLNSGYGCLRPERRLTTDPCGHQDD